MYYIELIERFWNFNKIIKASPKEIALYLYLLKFAYENNSYDFKISDSQIARELGFTRKAIKMTKDKLKNLGLLHFQTSNGVPSDYRLLLNYSFDLELNEKETSESYNNNSLQELKVLDFDQENQTHNKESINIPSLVEFMSYAKTLTDYESQFDLDIKLKYQEWLNQGWKNAANRPITNWKLILKSSLPYIKNVNQNNLMSVQEIPTVNRPKNSE